MSPSTRTMPMDALHSTTRATMAKGKGERKPLRLRMTDQQDDMQTPRMADGQRRALRTK